MKPSDSLFQFVEKLGAAVVERQGQAVSQLQRNTKQQFSPNPHKQSHWGKLGAFLSQAVQKIGETSTQSISYLKLKHSIANEIEEEATHHTQQKNTTQVAQEPAREVQAMDNHNSRQLEIIQKSVSILSEQNDKGQQAAKTNYDVAHKQDQQPSQEEPKQQDPQHTLHRNALLKFTSSTIFNVVEKNSADWGLFKEKLSSIKKTDSIRYDAVDPSAEQQEQRVAEKSERPNRSSTKSIKLTENSLDQEEPFNLTIKTRVDGNTVRPSNQSSYTGADSLNYSRTNSQMIELTAGKMDSFDRRAQSPDKKPQLEEIPDDEFIPQQLKYSAEDLKPDSPVRLRRTEQTQPQPTKLEVIRKQVEEMQKKSHLDLNEQEEEQRDEASIEEGAQQEDPGILDDHPSPKLEVAASQVSIKQQPAPYPIRQIKKHKVRLQKDILRDSKNSQHQMRMDSVGSHNESRQDTEQSMSQQVSRKNLSISSRKDEKSVRAPSRSNIFNTEIDSYKQRIVMLHEAKSRKRLLEEQLHNINDEIDVLKKLEEPTGSVRNKNKIREFIGISDDHQARVRAVQLVNRMKKEREKKQRNILQGFSGVDKSIVDNMNQLAKIREERQKRSKQQRKLEVLERMREHERKKQEDHSLKQASRNFVYAIKQDPPPSALATQANHEPESMPQRQRTRKQPTEQQQYTPSLKPQQSQLQIKKEKLRRVRKFQFNYVSKRSIMEDYNALLFKN